MTKHCQNCTYHMSGNPPVCNALHTPTYDPIECVDWEASETFKTYSGERLDQGQMTIAEIIQRGRSEQVEQWRNYLSIECLGAIEEAVRSQVDLLPDHLQHLVFHNRNLLPSFFRLASQHVTIPYPEYWENDRLVELAEREAMMQSQVNQSFGYEIQESIEARRAAIFRNTQRQEDEAIARNTHSPITLSELRTAIRGVRNPTRSGERWHVALPDEPMLSYSIGLEPLPTSPSFRQITLTAIATPNGLKWQYQGAVIID